MRALLLALCLFAGSAHASRNGFFYEPDKQVHITIFAAVGYTTAMLVEPKYGKFNACLAGIGMSLALGAAKEIYDINFDWRDMTANAIGGVLGGCAMRWEF